MAKQMHNTPNLDELENGPWPSFVSGLKRLAKDNDMMVDLMGQLETSYQTKFGYWKGGTVGVVGYGGGVIPRFTELKNEDGTPKFPEAAEFHTLRIMPPAGMHYTSDLLRQMCDAWLETGGSGLIACTASPATSCCKASAPRTCRWPSTNSTKWASTWVAPAPRCAPPCPVLARPVAKCPASTRRARCAWSSTTTSMTCTAPSLPYKFKFKFSGCPNDCVNSIQRSDMATIGTWRDNIQANETLAREWMASHSVEDLTNMVVSMCPTRAIRLVKNDGAAGRGRHQGCGVRRQLPRDRQPQLRALHALPQRHARRPAARQGQGRDHPGRRQARAEDRRPDGHRGHPLHEAGVRRGLREAERSGRTISTSSPRTPWNTSVPAR
jgi:sulfite reductase alpha subunit